MRFWLLLFTLPVFAGDSINAGGTVSASLTGQAKANPSRVEFYLHDWTATSSGALVNVSAVGFTSYWSAGAIEMYNTWESGGVTCRISVADVSASSGVYIRFQHDAVNGWDVCEGWKADGTLVGRAYPQRYTSQSSGTGTAGIDVTASNTKIGWVRVLTSLVDPNDQIPIANNTETRLLDWKFDNNLNDSSGNGWTGSGTSITYSTSPTPTRAARIRTLKTPYKTDYTGYSARYLTPWWAEWISLRAGASNQLSGEDSFSQVDSVTPTYFWQQLSGPTTLTWSSRTSATPVITGAIFGTYTIQLTYGDGTNTSTVTLDIGAVAHADNGVVIQSKSAADTIFGPMIAYGRSPWGMLDNRAAKVRAVQPSYLTNSGFGTSAPAWFTPNTSGTVAFRRIVNTGTTTTLTSGIDATTRSIPIADAAQLDLSSLPTIIMIANGGSYEAILIESTTATSGAATLTAAFGGRGLSVVGSFFSFLTSSTHSNGAVVSQFLMSGTSTNFSGDATQPVCPAGVPGPPGSVAYSIGTVTVSGTTVTGSGTTWNTANGVEAGRYIRIAATHSTGTPFVWWARISSVDSTTQLTVEKAMPSGTDSASFTYKIVRHNPGTADQLNVAPNMPFDDNTTSYMQFSALACASDTRLAISNVYEASWVTATTFSGKAYTTYYGQSVGTEYGPNFYGTGLALRADYYRSGYTPSLAAANGLDEHWPWHPSIQGGGHIFNVGGPHIGAAVCKILGDCSLVEWGQLRDKAARYRLTDASNCDTEDLRNKSYPTWMVALLAVFDPSQSSTFQGYLNTALSKYTSCVGTGGYESGSYFNATGYSIGLTANSTAGTGTGLPSSVCHGTASGTATATNGSGALTGTGFVSGGSAITLTGTIGGSTQSIRCGYSYNSSTSVTLACLWPGSTGTIDWMIEDTTYQTAIGATYDDANLYHNYACMWNSSSSITLNRPWRGSTGSYKIYTGNITGRGSQPFMAGIAASAARIAANVSAQASSWNTTLSNLATWYLANGYSTDTKGQYYGRGFEWCEPKGALHNPSFDFTGKQLFPECLTGPNYNSGPDRMLIGEAISSLGPAMLALDAGNQTFVDQVFTSLWGADGYDWGDVPAPDLYSGGNTVSVWNLNDASLAAYKWPGFFFGVGMAHRYPAERAGGIPAQSMASYQFYFTLPSGANKVALTVIRPNGETVTPATCTTSPCSFTYDSRQGTHLVRWTYQTTGGATVAQSDYAPIN